MAWLLLVVAGLLEIVWALALKHAQGLTRLGPSVLGISTAAVSFVMLSAALKHLPVGTAYAVWVGIGAAGVALAGIVMLGESASLPRLSCVALILSGVIGLKLLEE
ncbi:quaternary ammonium compound efflux SMR transporter SugE [Pyxidicoccus xibeiensis]|uniref:quaternary ammonium compound efflux SMR transporter SugE n=1 Tax=Pyxidicoccus xibeiensis TaxID=2906759 RepID=UPI0020A7A790|nr:quaternary ammonium compound efflux SMR transporter SugE [Pyxidicoccus xibeiensis]MCP3140631.1 quaternary ammonium compound efflux SMR transporter SugE [Pyxidicoccus xibeiensis]